MKRSEINGIMKDTLKFCEDMNFLLPPFVHWTPKDWESKGEECREIIENQLGWDITDFGSGDFYKEGLMMITLRNGNFKQMEAGIPSKPYAEKLLIVREGQVTPMHYHYKKYEDIINRGGGNLIIKLYNKTEDDRLADTPVQVHIDGVLHTVAAGEEITIKPGESVCLFSGLYHTFWGEPGTGTILVGEVSKVNDDFVDNRFLDEVGRFPAITEDEPALHLLYTEYPAIL